MSKNTLEDSDLEEGEILDDSPSDERTKTLPRRYVLHENKRSQPKLHRKHCKYAHDHSDKLFLKQKSSKVKNIHRKHRKSCSQHNTKSRESSRPYNYHPPNSIKTTYDITLIGEIKNSHKNIQIPSLTNLSDKVAKVENPSRNSCNFNEMLDEYRSIQSQVHSLDSITKPEFETLPDKYKNTQSQVNSPDCLTEPEYVIVSDSDKDAECVNLNINEADCNEDSKSTEDIQNEESEDEEELRRIALESCNKKLAENMSCLDSSVKFPLIKQNDSNTFNNITSENCDNYEVVDMEIDDISEEENNLFVIDNQPSIVSKNNLSLPEPDKTDEAHMSESDSDFEAELLRAELISRMFSKVENNESINQLPVSNTDKENVLQNYNGTYKKDDLKKDNLIFSVSKVLENKKHNDTSKEVNLEKNKDTVITVTKILENEDNVNSDECKKDLKNEKESNFHLTKTLEINDHNNNDACKEISLPKDKNSHFHLNHVLEKEQPPKNRFVIKLDEESSSEDSDLEDSEQECPESENAVASLEALISSARHQSCSNENNVEDLLNVPDAVSCLSKAQQEEYNNLLKILSKNNEKISNFENGQLLQNKRISKSDSKKLKYLEHKLLDVKENLRKQKLLLSSSVKEVSEKKHLYMKSKLTSNHLKERYYAAEKVRRVHLQAWANSSNQLKTVKGSVNALEKQLLSIQNMCSKLGSCIAGKQYALPTSDN